jgi:hypothetical protein
MNGKYYFFFLAVCSLSPTLADQSWKDRPVPEWTESDARQILSDSPWSKSVTAKVNRQSNNRQGSRGGIGIGGIGIPRIGGRGGGMGRGSPPPPPDTGAPSTFTLRWESALPVQEAHLKIHDEHAPSVDEGYYTIAVLGLPYGIAGADPKDLESRLKHQAELRRDGRKAIRSADARVLPRDDGVDVLFLFPKSEEITRSDKRVEFQARIGAFELAQSFDLSEMMYDARLEL